MSGLFDIPPPDPPLLAAWKVFHAANPKVYALFERFALEAARRGRTRFGARMIWERMRWYVKVETTDQLAGLYKLNDHHHPYYAREFVRRRPEFRDLFEFRKVQT